MATCTCTSSTASSATIWFTWNGTTGTCATTDTVWDEWASSDTGTTASDLGLQAPTPLTAEQIEAQRVAIEQRRAAQAEAARKQAEEAKAAEERAAALLQSHLDDEQRKALAKSKKFHVIGSDGERYEIETTKRTHNVFALDAQGRRTREFCAYQTGETPLSDNALAQKLLLEADAESFKRIANKWDLEPRRPVAAG